MRRLLLLFVLFLGLLTGCGVARSSTQASPQASAVGQIAAVQETTKVSPSVVTATPTILPAYVAPETPVPATSSTTLPTMPSAEQSTPTQVGQADGDVDAAQQMTRDRAQLVVETLKQRDMQKLAGLVHPEQGLRFSPYAAVNEQQLVFTAQQLAAIDADTATYTWGAYDGTGFPIELTVAGYFDKFVYSQDFAQASRVGYNEAVGKGNSYNHARSFYGPDATIVEYHFPGFNPVYEGMDWASLQVVLEQFDQQWYVTGLIHDQWTI